MASNTETSSIPEIDQFLNRVLFDEPEIVPNVYQIVYMVRDSTTISGKGDDASKNRSSRVQQYSSSDSAKEHQQEIQIPVEAKQPIKTERMLPTSKVLDFEDRKFRQKLFSFLNQFMIESKKRQLFEEENEESEADDEEEEDPRKRKRKFTSRRNRSRKEESPSKKQKYRSELEKEDEEMDYNTKRSGLSQADRARGGRHSGIMRRIESPNVSEDDQDYDRDLEKYKEIKAGLYTRSRGIRDKIRKRLQKHSPIGKGSQRPLYEEQKDEESTDEEDEVDEDIISKSRPTKSKGKKSRSNKSESQKDDEKDNRSISAKGGRHSGIVRRVERELREGRSPVLGEEEDDLEKYYEIKGPHRPYRGSRGRSRSPIEKSRRRIQEEDYS